MIPGCDQGPGVALEDIAVMLGDRQPGDKVGQAAAPGQNPQRRGELVVVEIPGHHDVRAQVRGQQVVAEPAQDLRLLPRAAPRNSASAAGNDRGSAGGRPWR